MRSARVLASIVAASIPAALLYAQTPAGRSARPDTSKKAEKAQEKPVDWGALFKIHYENRVRSFREQNLVFRNVVLLGDSITEGFEVTRYFPGRRVLNRGIGADVIGNAMPADDHRGVLRRLDCSVFECAATDVFLMIGINDLNSGRTVDTMEAGYREILRQIKERAPGVRVHVESVLPTRGAFAKHNAPVKDFNSRLRRLAGEFGYPYVDLHAQFIDQAGELRAEYTNDGLHLTEPGYQVWRVEIEKAMGWQAQAK